MSDLIETLASYVPVRIARRAATDPGPFPRATTESFPAAVLFADISGFTALAERLAARGAVGAEDLTRLLNAYLGRLVEVVAASGGDVLKFRGDALLLLFSGDVHAERACRAASEMQWFIDHTGGQMSSVGEVQLSMATGIYSGTCHFFLVESSGAMKAFGALTFVGGFAITLFEMFVAALQAYIFVVLTAVYLSLSISDEH